MERSDDKRYLDINDKIRVRGIESSQQLSQYQQMTVICGGLQKYAVPWTIQRTNYQNIEMIFTHIPR